MSLIRELWACEDEAVWLFALKVYWLFVGRKNMKLEKELQGCRDVVEGLGSEGWYDFLLYKYFPWKFTVYLAARQKNLRRQVSKDGLDKLYEIKGRLFALDPAKPDNTGLALTTADEIGGLGPAGASGLLAVLFPEHFGTVDQFVVRALQSIDGLPERDFVRRMNPVGFTPQQAAAVVDIMRKKAEDNNLRFGRNFWTPRKIDMILWTYGREGE
jgi:hypothetical protein